MHLRLAGFFVMPFVVAHLVDLRPSWSNSGALACSCCSNCYFNLTFAVRSDPCRKERRRLPLHDDACRVGLALGLNLLSSVHTTNSMHQCGSHHSSLGSFQVAVCS